MSSKMITTETVSSMVHRLLLERQYQQRSHKWANLFSDISPAKIWNNEFGKLLEERNSERLKDKKLWDTAQTLREQGKTPRAAVDVLLS